MSDAYTPEQAAQINWKARWQNYNIPVRFRGLGLADMQPTQDNARALGMAHGIVASWRKRRPLNDDLPEDRSLLGKGGILIGPAATGKTRLACAIATDVARAYNTAVLYISVTGYFALQRDIREATDRAVKLRDEAAVEEVRRLTARRKQILAVPLLVWDDLGKEHDAGSGWTGSEVYRITRARHDACRPTLITTNVPLPEWSERYESAMFSFLHEAFDAAPLGGTDWRRAGR